MNQIYYYPYQIIILENQKYQIYNLEIINIQAKEAKLKIPLILKILKQNKMSSMHKLIEELRDDLYNIVNERSYNFLKNINLI